MKLIRTLFVTNFLILALILLFYSPANASVYMHSRPDPTMPNNNVQMQKQQVMAFLKNAKAYIRKYGRNKALKEFDNQNGKFYNKNKGLYIFAFVYNGRNKGKILANGINPSATGNNHYKNLDAKKEYYMKRIVAAAQKAYKNKSSYGMATYYWKNPATGRAQKKISYIIPINSLWAIGAGYYLPSS